MIEEASFKPWEMPVDQQNGIQLLLPELVNVLSFQSVKDYEDYICRLTQMPRLLDQTIVQKIDSKSNAFYIPSLYNGNDQSSYKTRD